MIIITGKTNSGKSTLFNKLINKNISIVTNKKNTTIRCVEGYYSTQKKNIKIIDTPGPIINNKINTNKLIYDTINKAEIIIILIEKTKLGSEDFFLFELIQKIKKNIILLINKTDEIKNKETILEIIKNLKIKFKTAEILPISVKNNINSITNIIEKIPFTSITKINKIENSNEFIKDIVREALLLHLEKELPYTTKIIINKQEQKNFQINIIIRKICHKKIIIGKSGDRLKLIIKHIKNKLYTILHKNYSFEINFKINK